MASSPTATTTPAKMSHLRFVFMSCSKNRELLGCSLVSQRFDWIEQRCFSRWVISEKHSHSYREHGCHDNGFHRHFDGPLQGLPNHIRTKDPHEHTGCASDQAKHDRFS